MSINSFGLSAEITKSLHDAAVDTLNVQNAAQLEMKRVSYETMCEVIDRSLASTTDLPTELREFRALKDLSAFLSLAHYNKVVGPVAANTDLLAIGHPLSTAFTTLSYEERINARASWFVHNPSVLSTAVALVASATPQTPEMTYAHARLCAAGFPQEYLSALVASFNTGVGGLDGANHGYWRIQRRDRLKRFAFMGGGISLQVRLSDGTIRSLGGRYVGMDQNSPDTVDIATPNNTVLRVPLSKSQSYKAYLSGGSPDGYSANAVDVPADDMKYVVDQKDIQVLDAPAGWTEVGQPETRPDGSVYRVFTDASKSVQVGLLKKDGEQDRLVVTDPSKDPSNPQFLVGQAQTWYQVDDLIDENTPDNVKQAAIAHLSDVYSKELTPEQVKEMVSRGGETQAPEAPQAEAPAAPQAEAPAPAQAPSGDILSRIDTALEGEDTGANVLLKKAKAFIEQGQITQEGDTPESMADKLRKYADILQNEDNKPELAQLFNDAAKGIEDYKSGHYKAETPAATPEPTPEAHPAVDDSVPPTAGNVESSSRLTGDEIQAMMDGEGIDDTYDSSTTAAPEEIKPTPKEAKQIAKDVAPKADEHVAEVAPTPTPEAPTPTPEAPKAEEVPAAKPEPTPLPTEPIQDTLPDMPVEDKLKSNKEIIDGLKAEAQAAIADGTDILGRKLPAGWKATLNHQVFETKNYNFVPKNIETLRYTRAVGKAHFTAYLSEDGTLHIVKIATPDGIIKEKYDNWEAFDADLPALNDALSGPSREDLYTVLEDKGISVSDMTRAAIDSGADAQTIEDALLEQADYAKLKEDYTNAQWADMMSPTEKAVSARYNAIANALRQVVVPATKPEPKPEPSQADTFVKTTPYDGSGSGLFSPSSTPKLEIKSLKDGSIIEFPKPVGAPRRVTTTVGELKAGDVLVNDHFVVEEVVSDAESKSKKENGVWVIGHYAGHVSQKTKLWKAHDTREVFRDVVPPAAGDKPVLSKPWMKDYGKTYKDKQTGEWKFVHANDEQAFNEAQAQYDAALKESFDSWQAPADAPSIDLTQAPKVYKDSVKAKDLVAGDVTFRPENPNIKFGIEPFNSYFIIDEVLPEDSTVAGKIGVRGHFEGHAPQVKYWNPETQISTIRGLDPTPAGQGPELHRPANKDFKTAEGKSDPEAYQKAAVDYYNQLKNSSSPFAEYEAPSDPTKVEAPTKPQKPWGLVSPSFVGEKMQEILAKVFTPKQLKDALDQQEIIYFDFETSAQSKDFGANSVPIQVAAHKVKNGVVTDSITLFMNPNEPLGDFYYKQEGSGKDKKLVLDEKGQKILDTSILAPGGKMISDEWLSQQPSVGEQMKKFFDWMGESPILAAHNGYDFDNPILRHQAKLLGLDFKPGGQIDTLAIAQNVIDPSNKKTPRNLGVLTERYGIKLDGWHDAAYDSIAVHGILNGLLDEMQTKGVGWEILDPNADMQRFEAEGADYIAQMTQYGARMDAYINSILDNLITNQNAPEVSIDSLIQSLDTSPIPNPDGIFNDPVEAANPPFDMPVADPTDTVAWVKDDENTTLIEGKIRPTDFVVGDYMPSLHGGYMQITGIEDDPADLNRIIIHRKAVGSDYTDTKNWFRYSKTYEGIRRPVDKAADMPLEGQTTIDEALSTDAPSNVQPDMPEMTADQGLTPSFNITNWKKIGGQGGSNAGGVYEDENGNRYYVKFPSNKEHALSEALASALYVEAGLPVGRVMLGTNDKGDTLLVSPWLNDSEKNFDVRYNEPAVRADAQRGFAVDAWLLNWDAVGLAHDNMILVGDSVYRIDPGGALGFRAQGAKKNPSNLTPEVQEIDSMRKQGTAKTVFGGMSDEQIAESVKLVAAISPERIDQLVGMAFPNDNSLATLLKDRRQNLIDRFSPASVAPVQATEATKGETAPSNPADMYEDGTTVGKLPQTPEEKAAEEANKPAANPPTPASEKPFEEIFNEMKGIGTNDFNVLDGWVTFGDGIDILLPAEGISVKYDPWSGNWFAYSADGIDKSFGTRKEAVDYVMGIVGSKKPALSPQGQEIDDLATAHAIEPFDAPDDIAFNFFPKSEEMYVFNYDGGNAHIKWDEGAQGYKVDISPVDENKPEYFADLQEAVSHAIDTLLGKPKTVEPKITVVPAENTVDKFLTKYHFEKKTDTLYISSDGNVLIDQTPSDNTWFYVDGETSTTPATGFASLEEALTALDQHLTKQAGGLDDTVSAMLDGTNTGINVDEHIAFTKDSKFNKEDASFIVKQLKAAYPDHKVLENGHLQLFTVQQGNFEYSVNVARHLDETFTVYGVQTNLQTGEKRYYLNGHGNKRHSFTAILTPIHNIESVISGNKPQELFDVKKNKKFVKPNLADYDFFDPEVLDINYGIDFTQSNVEGFIGYMSEKSIPKTSHGMTEALYSAIEDMAGNNYAIVTQSMLDSLYNIDGAPKEMVDKVIQDLKNTLSDKPVIVDGKIIGQHLPHVYADGTTEAKVGDRVTFEHKGVIKHATVVKLQATLAVKPKNGKTYAYSDYTRILIDGEKTPRTKVSSKLSLETAAPETNAPEANVPNAPEAPKATSFSTMVISNDFSKTHTLSKEPNGSKASMEDLVDQGVGYTKDGKAIVLNDETMANLVANNDPTAMPASQLKSDDFITFLNEDGTGLDYAQALTVFPDYANEGSMSVIAVMNNGDGTFSAKQFSIPESADLTVVRPQNDIASYAKPKTKVTEAEPTVEDVVSFTEAVAADVNAQGVDTTNADTIATAVNDELVAPKPDAPTSGITPQYFTDHPDEFVFTPVRWIDVTQGDVLSVPAGYAKPDKIAVVDSVISDGDTTTISGTYADGAAYKVSVNSATQGLFVDDGQFKLFRHKSMATQDLSKAVTPVSFKDAGNKNKFVNIKKALMSNIKVGDLIPQGTGASRYYMQVLAIHTSTVRKPWGENKTYYMTVRYIRQDPSHPAHGKIKVVQHWHGLYKNVKRPTASFSSKYNTPDATTIDKTSVPDMTPSAPAPKTTAPNVKAANGVSVFNTEQELIDAGSFDKTTPQFYQMFDANDYNEYKTAFKKTTLVLKDGGASQKYLVPGMIVKDKESGSHGILEEIDPNTKTTSVMWMSGSKAGTADSNYAATSLEATKHMFTAEKAGELGAVVDGLFEKRVKEEVQKIQDAKAAQLAAEIAKAEADAKAKEAAEAHLNATFPKGSGVDHISVEGPTDWSVTNFSGTHSLTSALNEVNTSKISGREGVVVLTDSDSVEDAKVRVQKINMKDGTKRTRLTFKLTDWVGNTKVKTLNGLKIKASPAMEVTRYLRQDDGTGTYVLTETGTTFDTNTQGSDTVLIGGKAKGQTFRETIYDSDGNEIGYYLFHRANKTSVTPEFETTKKSSSNAPVTFHNTVEIILNDDATPEQISQALHDAGVAEPRPATQADITMVAENKILALFAPKPASGARNYAGQERIDALAKVLSKYGVNPADVEVVPAGHGRDVQYLLPRSVGEHLAKLANVAHFHHTFTGGGGSSSAKETFDRIANQSGLISSYERMMNGINKGGMSTTTDITLAGGQSMFLHQSSGKYDPNWKPYSAHGSVYFDAAELLRRIDYYSNNGDGYGQKQTNVVYFDRLKGSPHETMFKNGMYWHSVIRYGMDPAKAQQVYEMFVQAGIVEIDGVSVKEILGL